MSRGVSSFSPIVTISNLIRTVVGLTALLYDHLLTVHLFNPSFMGFLDNFVVSSSTLRYVPLVARVRFKLHGVKDQLHLEGASGFCLVGVSTGACSTDCSSQPKTHLIICTE